MGVLLAMFAGLAAWQSKIAINHDVAAYLFAADAILSGGSYPGEFYDINPPAIVLLSVPPVVLARWTHLTLPDALIVYVYALVILSLALCRRVIGHAPAEERLRTGLLLGAFGVLLLAAPGFDLGQREHLACIFGLPYVFLLGCRWNGAVFPKSSTVAISVFAAIGLYLKPTLAVLPIAAFVIDACRTRSVRHVFSAEVLAFVGYGIAEIGVILLAFPNWLPIALDGVHTYPYYAGDLGVIIPMAAFRIALGVLAAVIAWRLASSSFQKSMLAALVLFFLVTVFSLVVQSKGWSYHMLPIGISGRAIYVWAALLALAAWRRGRIDRFPAVAIACVALLFAVVTTLRPVADTWRTNSKVAIQRSPLFQALNRDGKDRNVMYLATDAGGAGLVMMAGAHWGSRFIGLLDLPYIVDKLAPQGTADPAQRERARRLDSFLKGAIASDIGKYRPVFILVDAGRHKQGIKGGAFDLLAYLNDSPDIVAQLNDYSPYVSADTPRGLMVDADRTFTVLRRTTD